MKLYIPTIGDQLRLTADWTFTLHSERRNHDFIKVLGLSNAREFKHTLPAGTVLKIERIYIRASCGNYDSVTFRVVGVKYARFWVTRNDANNIEFDHVTVK